MSDRSPREVLVARIKDLGRRVRSGAYSVVRRGAVDWSSFPFDKWPRAIAVVVSEEGFPDANGMTEVTISLEVFARVLEAARFDVDDELQEELAADARQIVLDLLQEADSLGDAVVYRVDEARARIIHVNDSQLRLQGAIAQFDAVY